MDTFTAPAAADRSDADVLETLFTARHSCRAFTGEPVPRPVIERVLRIAQKTASWCNTQPWQVVILGGAAMAAFRSALTAQGDGQERDIGPAPQYTGVYLERRRECGFALYESVGIARGDRAASARQGRENFRMFGAPHVAIVSTDEALGPYGAIDCGAFVSSFMLAAQSLGVASIAQAALATHSAFIRRTLALADDRRIVCGISFGYEDATHPANAFRTTRADLDQVVTWRD